MVSAHGVSRGRAVDRVSLTSVAWSPRSELGLADWIEQGRRLGVIGRGAAWWIGDWLCYGNERYGERYVRAARVTGYDVQTLMNMVYVASRIPVSRRREKLSWSHHADVAAFDGDRQEHWLAQAEAERWAVRDLRAQLRDERRRAGAAAGVGPAAGPASPPGAPEHASAPEDPADGYAVVVCPECGFRGAVGVERPAA